MSLLSVEFKKGNPAQLDGRLTVYARVEIDPGDMASLRHPVASMVNNGLLVAQGNFRDQNSLRDFLRSEMGLSLEEGLEQLLERADGLESALDPEKLRDKIQDMGEMEDFIPTPAKIVSFHSEDEVLEQDGDIFFAGYFSNAGNAVLCVNAVPILYQARYREQMLVRVRSEIDAIIAAVEQRGNSEQHYGAPNVDIERVLLKELIPNMLYCQRDEKGFANAENQFRSFMRGYQFVSDVDAIVGIIHGESELNTRQYKLLELYARKISCVHSEQFEQVEQIENEIRLIGDVT